MTPLSRVCPFLHFFSYALYDFQSIDRGSTRLLIVFSAAGARPWVRRSLLSRLQHLCASWRFARSDGCPPLFTGMMWSTVADKGWGEGIDLSTGFPQIAQMSWVAKILARFFS